MRKKLNQRGMTVIELTIVVVAISIISMLAIPRFEKVMERLKLKTAGRDVVSVLRLARSNAVSQRDQFGVYFDYNNRQYFLFRDISNPSSFTYDAGSDSIIINNILPGRVNFGYVNFPNSVIIFKPNGATQASGQAALYYYEDEYYSSMTIDVLGSTGRVKLISGDY